MSFCWTAGDGIAYGIICISILMVLIVGFLMLKKTNVINVNIEDQENYNLQFYELERKTKRAQLICTIGQFLCSFNLPIYILLAFVINL